MFNEIGEFASPGKPNSQEGPKLNQLGPNQKKWLEALKSGKYSQGTGALCRNGNYCCIGVACEVFEIPKKEKEGWTYYNGHTMCAPKTIIQKLSLVDDRGRNAHNGNVCLTSMNDQGHSFKEIADMIEINPQEWFKEPI